MTGRTLLDAAITNASLPVYLLDPRGTFIYVNAAMTTATGYSEQELLGNSVDTVLSRPTASEFLREIRLLEGITRRFDVVERHRDDTLHGAAHFVTPFVSDGTGDTGDTNYLVVRPETTSLQQLGEDPLTNVHLRQTISDEVDRELSRAQRHGHPLSILLTDVDGMKGINDDFGDGTGDAVLRSVATILSGCLRPSDRIGRWGGDDFLVLLPETDRSGAYRAAQRITAAFEETSILDDRIVTVTVGVSSMAPSDPDHPSGLAHSRESLVRLAEEELLQAKETGPGGVSG
jgi:diguanylate cyclase (GGDEF)-like protein/PAS domain S-box-containing protein